MNRGTCQAYRLHVEIRGHHFYLTWTDETRQKAIEQLITWMLDPRLPFTCDDMEDCFVMLGADRE